MKVIRVTKGGIIRTIYDESLPLRNLGRLSVSRASNVEFDDTAQGWKVTMTDGTTLPGVFASRAVAIRAEVAYLQEQLTQR